MSSPPPPPGSGQFQIQTNTGQRAPAAINIANYLFQNSILKQRSGLLDNKTDIEFFKYKRFERALLSDDYKSKQQNPKNGLIPIANAQEVQKIFVLLIQNQLILPINKLHYSEVKAIKGWKPVRDKPTFKRAEKAVIDPKSYFGWLYTRPNPYILLYSILAIAGVFTIILFPLWPTFMRRGVWYLSMGALGLIALFFVIAIIRLIIYIVSLVAFPKPFWLFPNLFADCGVIESFIPLYGWEEPKKKKSKKSKKASKQSTESSGEKIEPLVSKDDKSATGAETKPSNGETKSRKVILEEVKE
ncbi:SEC62 [Candida pseudojiufengensis]|uniref:SEC62 n=1 Tax=Candida pseudojiufengensis TaxID=497109 RepID=UPI0022246796|nr:SEC62 [Candida pseudojiufengensis]KAI5966254.1 SEC62 [Candida pseudojiufengensis]